MEKYAPALRAREPARTVFIDRKGLSAYNRFMKLYLTGHTYKYALEQIMLMLFPEERPEYPALPSNTAPACRSSLRCGGVWCTSVCTLLLDGGRFVARARVRTAELTDELTRTRLLTKIVKLAFYRAALRSGLQKPEWGALSGIRPTKLLTRRLEAGMAPEAALRDFCREYDVSPARAALCLDTAQASLRVQNSLSPRDVCLYIGIPFCPTRCAYCSFVSNSVEKSMKLVTPFLEALLREIDATAETVERLGLRVVSIYMGGGTPTTLSAEQLDRLCARLAARFDLSALREYTVEAGRPDTITAEKLQTLRAHGVGRISVNPQTMCDSVLEVIGRRHTAADILRALELVRAAGGFAVNMDLIAGLPSDTPERFSATLDQVLLIAPENITVHTLALKKGSRITLAVTDGTDTALPSPQQVAEMLSEAMRRLRDAGYAPYYLYRQKFMSGGFENVGWTKPGFENLYNVCIMEELCSILAMGGGASTKLVDFACGRIERVFAPKYPQEYIASIEKVISDKSKVEVFYRALAL